MRIVMQACGSLKACFIPVGNVRSLNMSYIIKSCFTVSRSLLFNVESLFFSFSFPYNVGILH